MRQRAATAAEVLLLHPRHLVLFAAVAGLLLGPSSRAAVAAAAALVLVGALVAEALSRAAWSSAEVAARPARLPGQALSLIHI